jgi:tetratricopeptide (TPR) repeat protein
MGAMKAALLPVTPYQQNCCLIWDEATKQAAVIDPEHTLFIAQLGQAYGLAGKAAKAREVLTRLNELALRKYVSPYHLAYVNTGLGEYELALDMLERAFAERAGAVYGLKGSFLFTPLQGHPRFQALLKKMNLA